MWLRFVQSDRFDSDRQPFPKWSKANLSPAEIPCWFLFSFEQECDLNTDPLMYLLIDQLGDLCCSYWDFYLIWYKEIQYSAMLGCTCTLQRGEPQQGISRRTVQGSTKLNPPGFDVRNIEKYMWPPQPSCWIYATNMRICLQISLS